MFFLLGIYCAGSSDEFRIFPHNIKGNVEGDHHLLHLSNFYNYLYL